ncbi:MAG TPA: universal stress protein [Acidimicrobiia bacterium]|jgi:nucleotide-binding universal stress UspA family protein
MDAEVTGRIVVGVDGSEASDRALWWAAEESRLRRLPLLAVTCWTFPALVSPVPFQPPISAEVIAGEAQAVLKAAVERVLGRDADTLDWEGEVVEGAPSLRLLELSKDAAMVVVGSRGRGGFTGLLLGSVSQHLAEHASCPVMVLR